MGSFKGQKSPGKYMCEYLHENLKVMAKAISKDMTFLGIIFSSTLEVGTGKSVLTTQIGEDWTEIVNEMYGLNIPFNVDNIVWRPKDLIDRSFHVPKYSCIILDEWEDSGYWSELGMTLRQFFRKCRQLNLFMLCIIPNWFQLPLSYAVSRSAFAIDVKFGDGFSRGHFDFYGFNNKKDLYIKGKKFHNYYVAKPNFFGNFTDGYGVDEVEYRKRKLEDMEKWDKDEDKGVKSLPVIRKEAKAEILQKLLPLISEKNNRKIMAALGISEPTFYEWIKVETISNNPPVPLIPNPLTTIINKPK